MLQAMQFELCHAGSNTTHTDKVQAIPACYDLNICKIDSASSPTGLKYCGFKMHVNEKLLYHWRSGHWGWHLNRLWWRMHDLRGEQPGTVIHRAISTIWVLWRHANDAVLQEVADSSAAVQMTCINNIWSRGLHAQKTQGAELSYTSYLGQTNDDWCASHEASNDRVWQEVGDPSKSQQTNCCVQGASQQSHLQWPEIQGNHCHNQTGPVISTSPCGARTHYKGQAHRQEGYLTSTGNSHSKSQITVAISYFDASKQPCIIFWKQQKQASDHTSSDWLDTSTHLCIDFWKAAKVHP